MPLEVSFMFHGANPSTLEEDFRKALAMYGDRSVLDGLNIEILDWERGWNRLVQYAAYNRGPDVSEIGSTWLSALVAMDAIRPLEPEEATALQYGRTFVPGMWEVTQMPGTADVWAVPLFADVRVVFVWRDMLEAAGVDPEQAFTSLESVEATFTALQAHGVATPFAIPMGSNARFLHLQMAISWVWAAGGDLFSPDYSRVALLDGPALEGLKAFYRLARFMPVKGQILTDVAVNAELFTQRRIAATIAGMWMWGALQNLPREEWEGKLDILHPPARPFLGGSLLVIWRHSLRRSEVLKFLRAATNPDVQTAMADTLLVLPVRTESLERAPFTEDPYLQRLADAVRVGRGYPTVPLLGIVEDRITDALMRVWHDVLNHPTADPEPFIKRHLEPTVARLNEMLAK
ncbi:extracellular solute-binding protein [Ardenticatena maritima]|nr:extracellular solute-binding protein [Ardenticatena maritima]